MTLGCGSETQVLRRILRRTIVRRLTKGWWMGESRLLRMIEKVGKQVLEQASLFFMAQLGNVHERSTKVEETS